MDFITKLPRTRNGHDAIWVVVDRLTKSAHFLEMREDYSTEKLARLYTNKIVAHHRVPVLIISDRHETTDKVVVIKEKLKAARDRQKSYADNMRKPLEFEVEDHVMLKVSPWKGVVHFGKKGKLAPSLHVPLDEIKVDKTLCFVEEPVEIMDHEIKSLKRSKISLVKVHWNLKHGPELTWERKDYMKSKYPQLFVESSLCNRLKLNLRRDFPKGGRHGQPIEHVHDVILEKCLGNANLHVPLNEIKIDKTLRFVEELVEIMDHEIKSLKRSKISLVKVHWNLKHGPELTWERKDYMKSKYPQLFVDRADESAS
ncbi:putative reverse transcriptase domain-containing protein [Tanacetum coccineum]